MTHISDALRAGRPLHVLRILVATALVAIGLTAVPPAAHANNSEDEKTTLTIGLIDPTIDSFNPFTTVYQTTTGMHRLNYDFLTNYSPEDYSVTEGLSDEWEHSEDGRTWTYHIRESTWSDGEPVTANDVAFTYNTIIENADSGSMTNKDFLVPNVESVTALDDRTVEIQLKKPSATMEALDIPIVPEHIWKDKDPVKDKNYDFPSVVNGPWIPVEYKRNESITLEANEDYWRGAPGFDRLVYRFYKDGDAAVEALRNGEVSFFPELTGLQAEALEGEENIEVNAADGKRFTGFTINPFAEAQNGEPVGDGHPALKDPRVRTAILHALDREALTDKVFSGYFEPDGSYIPSMFDTYHWEPEGDEVIEFDPEQAKALLDQAGYKEGPDGVRQKDGRPLEFRQIYHSDDALEKQMAQFVEDWLAEIGIAVTSTPSDDITTVLDSAKYEILWTGWTVNPDPQYILSIQLCTARPQKPGGDWTMDAWYCNEEYDKLFHQQEQELDPEARIEQVKQMQEIMYKDGVIDILGYEDQLEAYRTDVIEEGSIETQPGDTGVMYRQDGLWAFWSAQPAGSEDGGEDGGVSGTAVGVGIGAVVVVAAGAFLFLRRRSATAGDRE